MGTRTTRDDHAGHGHDDHHDHDHDLIAPRYSNLHDLASINTLVEQALAAPQAERIAILQTVRNMLTATEPPRPMDQPPATERTWLVQDCLPLGEIGLLTGAGQVGKSTLALQIANAISGGSPIFAAPTDPAQRGICPPISQDFRYAPTMIVNWEDSYDEAVRRLRGIRRISGDSDSDGAVSRIHYLSAHGAGHLWSFPDHRRYAPPRLTDFGRKVQADAEQVNAALLIIDPLATAFGGDENSRELTAAFLETWAIWAERAQIAVLFLAHPPKSEAYYSGSTAWHAQARFLWHLSATEDYASSPSEPPTLKLQLMKSNYAVNPSSLPPIPLQIRTIRRSETVVDHALQEITNPDEPPAEPVDYDTLPGYLPPDYEPGEYQ